jgi:hypothetical protein
MLECKRGIRPDAPTQRGKDRYELCQHRYEQATIQPNVVAKGNTILPKTPMPPSAGLDTHSTGLDTHSERSKTR